MKKLTTILITLAYIAFLYAWSTFGSATEASIAVRQVEDSIVVYSAAEKFSQGSIPFLGTVAYLAMILTIWFNTIKTKLTKTQ
jgi:hypothetical protein